MTRVALVGLGTMGRNHLRVLGELDDAELVGICDLDANAVETLSRKHSVPGYTSWDEMYAREKPVAVVVAVPTRFHIEAGMAAIERGLHVLIEKPIAATLEEGRRLVDGAARAGVKLAVGHVERFNPAVRELQRRLVANELGRLFQVHARRQGPFPARIRDVGVVIDLATHDLDVMAHLAGGAVLRLYGETEQRIHTEHEDILNALLKFDTGLLGVLQVNWLTPTKVRELSVLGERGMFICNYLTQELVLYKNAEYAPADARRYPRAVVEGEAVAFPITKGEPLRLELRSFIDAAAGRGPVEVDGAAGLRALHLALAVVRSASESRVLDGKDLDASWAADSTRSGGRARRPDRDDQ